MLASPSASTVLLAAAAAAHWQPQWTLPRAPPSLPTMTMPSALSSLCPRPKMKTHTLARWWCSKARALAHLRTVPANPLQPPRCCHCQCCCRAVCCHRALRCCHCRTAAKLPPTSRCCAATTAAASTLLQLRCRRCTVHRRCALRCRHCRCISLVGINGFQQYMNVDVSYQGRVNTTIHGQCCMTHGLHTKNKPTLVIQEEERNISTKKQKRTSMKEEKIIPHYRYGAQNFVCLMEMKISWMTNQP